MPMPDFTKSPPELVERFDAVAADFPEAQRRLTFGYPCLYVGGNMVTGLFQNAWHVRLGDTEQAEALALEGAAPFEPMPGRPMTGFTVLPPSVVADDAAIRRWVARAIAFGATMPAKPPKSKSKSQSKAKAR
jgi:TfoX/Sxy family transcriptional regulator of competence genes